MQCFKNVVMEEEIVKKRNHFYNRMSITIHKWVHIYEKNDFFYCKKYKFMDQQFSLE